ncbi:general secretion pathway protein GspN [Pollutimonas subterranea]|uniref:Type II secretion system protein N n=1 Tax=Pollutimonas subterranea TaxID=2045210 RepID=A0A2N4UA11_9BURK|nr:type II secretion system protein N [Pollutimonas subterranea]PLC51846.1 general secretion pathway protein GspN [Pollutimonas subterranea]
MRRGVQATWLALLLAIGCTAALWALPARWVMAWIPESSPVRVTDASGTLWKASATMAVGVGGLQRTLPDPLQWRLSVEGGPHLILTHAWLRGPLTLALSWRGLRMSAQSLQLPASALTTVHGMFNTLDPGGELFINWPELFFGKNAVASKDNGPLLSAQWRNASSSLTRIRPLGEYTLILSQAAGNSIALALATNQGPWMMEGTGILSQAGRAQFDGKAWVHESASGDTHAALQGLLDAIGPRSGQNGPTIMKIR